MYYSQFQEDEFIVKYCERYKINLHPVAIEIGASNGIDGSNIRHFCTEKGFYGIYVEPHPQRVKELKHNTEGQNCDYLHAACVGFSYSASSSNQGKIGFKIEDVSDFSHIDKDSTLLVPCIDWFVIVGLVDSQRIGILSIDTEGTENEILKDVLFMNIKPQFIIIESNFILQRSEQIKLLNEAGYLLHKMKDKNMLWMDSGLLTHTQLNPVYDIK